jgi:hypothetical protein
MCPFCLATAAIIAGSATGTGGVSALVASTVLRRKAHKEFSKEIQAKEVEDGDSGGRSEAEEDRSS